MQHLWVSILRVILSGHCVLMVSHPLQAEDQPSRNTPETQDTPKTQGNVSTNPPAGITDAPEEKATGNRPADAGTPSSSPGGPPGGGPPGGGPPGGGPPGFQFPLDPVSAAIDLNGDRELSAEEMSKASESIKSLDKNKDGKLTSEEILPPFLLGGGPGGFGPFGGGTPRQLLREFDQDGDGILNKVEREAARKSAPPVNQGRGFGGPRGPGGPPGFGIGRNSEPPTQGRSLVSTDVDHFPNHSLYDTSVLRTIFIQFESNDWEQELADFHNTDVEVPAILTVDGKIYPDVGIHFRGMSSYMMVGKGYKRSLNLSMDFVDPDQRLYGYKTLNLLNSNGDPSMMSSLLYSSISRNYIAVPQANYVRVVINGECWGVYVNVQQFNKDFLQEHYDSTKGARWKVSGSPGADGGLRYLGEDIEEYRRRYEIKSKDEDESWQALIKLCKTLQETPSDQLEAALSPQLDLDGVLKFLALDCALVNSDGYWTRASDYSLYLDPNGQFHVVPHDMNEAFHGGGGPGFGPPGGGNFGPGGGRGRQRPDGDSGGENRPPEEPPRNGAPPPGEGFGPPGFGPPGGSFGRGRGGFGGPGRMMHGSVDLDPLVSLDDPGKPLRSKLLAVPALRNRYLVYVRAIAEKSLNWETIGPVVAQYRQLIEKDVEAETRKLASFEAFLNATNPEPDQEHSTASLRHFFEARRQYLLNHKDVITADTTTAQTVAPKPTAVSKPVSGRLVTKLGKKKNTFSAQPGPETPRIVINELMAANTKTVTDPQGGFDDWIELYNPTDAAILLSGMYLTDSDQAPRKWQFPDGTQIEAGGYLMIWADEQGKATEGLHANFKLSAKGEELYLVDTDGRGNTVIDHVKFGKQTDDVAYGRDPGSPDQWVPTSATPGAKNLIGE